MESDLQHQKQASSGLARYQSAPSSYFSSFLERESIEEFLNRPSSPETERILAGFLSSTGGNINENARIENLERINEREIEVKREPQNQITGQMKNESGNLQQQQQQNQRNLPSASPGFYQSQRWPANPNSGSNMDYRLSGSTGLDRLPPMRTGGAGNSNLVRHQSSPAGLFANIDIEKIMDKNTGLDNSSNAAGFGDSIGDDFSTGFPAGSWDEPSLKRLANKDRTLSGPNAYEIENSDLAGNRLPPLAHHLSLPKGSTFDKLMQFQDSVPCKMRAKRGFATHPRSIAERVRRTKISERMRKLQDLVPNMDKQTSTSDMLDLAVNYIKDLQEQVQVLTDSRGRCSCSQQQEQ